MHGKTNKIVIVGGGTAGWITAGTIAAKHCSHPQSNVEVILVESPNIPIIGVGEGTWPTMRSTLINMGISETDFIRECDASFKQGAKFAKWVTGRKDDFYYHPLVLPQGFGKIDLAPYWHQFGSDQSFSNAVCYQEAICEADLAPKTIRHNEFDALANYAYHLDAGKFSKFLQKHCTEKLNVKHVLADVDTIRSNINGDVDALITAQGDEIRGNLFVDCTGFNSLLIGKHYNVPFKSCSDILFIDTALAVQVPYQNKNSAIVSHTVSTGQTAGWIWDIGLQSRRGVGHVYSSHHISEEAAYLELESYVGPQFKDLSVRKIAIQSGHRERFWQNNVVAVGLSAGFLEPLEASALVLVELSAQMIRDQLPANRTTMDIVAKRFNQTFRYRWDKIIDFLKLHYVLTKRQEPFWQDNLSGSSIPPSLKDLLALWQHRSPSDFDFESNNEVFPAASYQYVLYGMGYRTDFDEMPQFTNNVAYATAQLAKNQELINQAKNILPTNRELLDAINKYGMSSL